VSFIQALADVSIFFKARWLMKYSSLPRLGELSWAHSNLRWMMWQSISRMVPQNKVKLSQGALLT
jgi:hypothetical protein